MRTWAALALLVGLGVPSGAAVFVGATRPEMAGELSMVLLGGGGVGLVVSMLGAGWMMLGSGGGGGSASGRRAFGPKQDPHPGPCPAWISSGAWQQRGDATRYAMGMPDPAAKGVDMKHRKVSPTQFESAPKMRGKGRVPSARFDRQLKETPPIVAQWKRSVWPVCCDKLAVLQSIQPSPDDCASLERSFQRGAWTDLSTMSGTYDDAVHKRRNHDEVIHAINIFACSDCGRVYASATRK